MPKIIHNHFFLRSRANLKVNTNATVAAKPPILQSTCEQGWSQGPRWTYRNIMATEFHPLLSSSLTTMGSPSEVVAGPAWVTLLFGSSTAKMTEAIPVTKN
jgi:hypothetical protein